MGSPALSTNPTVLANMSQNVCTVSVRSFRRQAVCHPGFLSAAAAAAASASKLPELQPQEYQDTFTAPNPPNSR